ncbi:MAG: hypothetical protein ACOYBW_08745 [Fluviibacter phosphoraccumulans]
MIYRTAVGVVAVTLLAATHWKAYTLGQDRINLQWSIDRAKRAAEHAKTVEEYRGREQALQALVDGFKRKSENEINRITRERDALVVSLRNRPEARGVLSCPAKDAEPAVGCTGAGLARPDAGFLAGYSADAAKLAAALNQCLDSYNEVKRKMDAGN